MFKPRERRKKHFIKFIFEIVTVTRVFESYIAFFYIQEQATWLLQIHKVKNYRKDSNS